MKSVNRIKTAVLVSGGGTNLQALIDEEQRMVSAGEFCPYKIEIVISSTKDAYALERAASSGIKTEVASPYSVMGAEAAKRAGRDEKRLAVSDKVLDLCLAHDIEAIVLAGFLTVLSGAVVKEYSGRIINLHPALLPKFGGVGMWGHHVHEAVLASGEKESGCTIHLVDSGCDTGKILLQRKVPVLPGDTPESLYARIAPLEHEAMVEGLKLLSASLSRQS
ncbi:MAG: phosphoribosylglycinamide formyltransferase [Treponemataceae bacterium]|nr:phosphoribosylglycinamide formyltransferase [Treponemataceae bacterium]